KSLPPLSGHTGKVHVALSADGERALSGGADATVRLWQLPRPGRPAATAKQPVGQLAFEGFEPDTWVELRQDGRPLTMVAPAVQGPVELARGRYEVGSPGARASGLWADRPVVIIQADRQEVVRLSRDPARVGSLRQVAMRPFQGRRRAVLTPDGKQVL